MGPSSLLRTFTAFASVAALLVGGLLAYEVLLVGPLATPERIAEYNFGSEAMIGSGGATYESRSSYLAFTAVPAVLLLAAAGAGFFGAGRGVKFLCVVSLFCTVAGLAFLLRGGG